MMMKMLEPDVPLIAAKLITIFEKLSAEELMAWITALTELKPVIHHFTRIAGNLEAIMELEPYMEQIKTIHRLQKLNRDRQDL